MKSLKTQILIHLRNAYPTYVHKGEILRLAMLEWVSEEGTHYETETAGRRCRELERYDKLIERKENENGEVMYRAKPIEEIAESPPEIELSPQQKLVRRRYNEIIENRKFSIMPPILPPAFKKSKVEKVNQKSLF